METRTANLQSSLIGQRLIESGLLSGEQLSEALQLQFETGLLFGEICLLKGWLTYPSLKQCLPTMSSRLGEKLLSHGYITMEQLWMSLLEQRHSGKKLGDILVARGWVDRAALEAVAPPLRGSKN